MKLTLINGDCRDVLSQLDVDCVFADPPDGIGLRYNGFKDKFDDYPCWLETVIDACMDATHKVWISYNALHTFLMGRLICDRMEREPDWQARQFIQTFTFGQNRRTDCGNGYRPMLRLFHKDAKIYPENIKVPSWRQLNGDKRAAKGGKVPLDVWDFPRVTGNSKQRRSYHPTQLHEGLVERAIQLSTEEDGHVVDPFGGTGTTLRVCKRINRNCTLIEKSRHYCAQIAAEHGLTKKESGFWTN